MLFYLFILNKCWIQALSGHYIVFVFCFFCLLFLNQVLVSFCVTQLGQFYWQYN